MHTPGVIADGAPVWCGGSPGEPQAASRLSFFFALASRVLISCIQTHSGQPVCLCMSGYMTTSTVLAAISPLVPMRARSPGGGGVPGRSMGPDSATALRLRLRPPRRVRGRTARICGPAWSTDAGAPLKARTPSYPPTRPPALRPDVWRECRRRWDAGETRARKDRHGPVELYMPRPRICYLQAAAACAAGELPSRDESPSREERSRALAPMTSRRPPDAARSWGACRGFTRLTQLAGKYLLPAWTSSARVSAWCKNPINVYGSAANLIYGSMCH